MSVDIRQAVRRLTDENGAAETTAAAATANHGPLQQERNGAGSMSVFDRDDIEAQKTTPMERRTQWILITISVTLLVALFTLAAGILIGFFAIRGTTSRDQSTSNGVVRNWVNSACSARTCSRGWKELPLLLLSLDGFRANYLLRNKTHAISRLIDCGSHAPFIYPSYPSLTFPNHYAIATGLYPESHGIVANAMYDATMQPVNDSRFVVGANSSYNPLWWRGEPIWNTVAANGKHSNCFFWPGADVSVGGKNTCSNKYDRNVPFATRVDQVVRWLLLDDTARPSFMTLYLDETDRQGHLTGPDSDSVATALLTVDAMINDLFAQLYSNDLLGCLNLILLADHGMQGLLKNESVPLNNYISTNGLTIYGGQQARIFANESIGSTVDRIVDGLECKNDHYRVYRRTEMPYRLHYRKIAERIGDVVVDGDLGWRINPGEESWFEPGAHGWDFGYDNMHALFVAYGPAFKQGLTIAPFQNVEIYNLMTDVLHLSVTAPNNGTLGTLSPILTQPFRPPIAIAPSTFDACAFTYRSCNDCDPSLRPPCTGSVRVPRVFIESGTPSSMPCELSTCNAMTIYERTLRLPSLVQFRIGASASFNASAKLAQNRCWFADDCSATPTAIEQRLNAANLSLVPLFFDTSTATRLSDARLIYEAAPMYTAFYTEVWSYLVGNITMAKARRNGASDLLVLVGPIFDYDADERADDEQLILDMQRKQNTPLPIPTHYYHIVVACSTPWSSSGQCDSPADSIAFVLPNQPNRRNACQKLSEYLFSYSARIRDVELLTGIQFFVDWSPAVAVPLRTRISERTWLASL